MNAHTEAQRDKLERDLLRTDQAIAKQTAIIVAASAKHQDLMTVRRSLLAAVAALQGETP